MCSPVLAGLSRAISHRNGERWAKPHTHTHVTVFLSLAISSTWQSSSLSLWQYRPLLLPVSRLQIMFVWWQYIHHSEAPPHLRFITGRVWCFWVPRPISEVFSKGAISQYPASEVPPSHEWSSLLHTITGYHVSRRIHSRGEKKTSIIKTCVCEFYEM